MERPYLSLIHRAGQSEGITFEVIENQMVYKVSKDEQSFIMYNVDPGLNSSTAFLIAKSKASTYATLAQANIPAVPHHFLLNPTSKYKQGDVYERAQTYFESFGHLAVVKRDDGSQGRNVYKVHSRYELKECLDVIFQLDLDASISPYFEADEEFRVVVLNGDVKIIFSKQKAQSWKHNLSQGAKIVRVEASEVQHIVTLARDAARALGLQFCTVDVLNTVEEPRVLEINASVFLSEYIKEGEQEQKEVEQLFRDVFRLRFQLM